MKFLEKYIENVNLELIRDDDCIYIDFKDKLTNEDISIPVIIDGKLYLSIQLVLWEDENGHIELSCLNYFDNDNNIEGEDYFPQNGNSIDCPFFNKESLRIMISDAFKIDTSLIL